MTRNLCYQKTISFLLREPGFILMVVRARRVDDRIRELCAEAVAAKSSHKAKVILAELQASLHQYIQRLRNRAAAILTGSELPPERRQSSQDRRKRSAA